MDPNKTGSLNGREERSEKKRWLKVMKAWGIKH